MAKVEIDEKHLTKGELRKLKALRKSIGDDLGSQAFVKWYERKEVGGEEEDPNITVIEDALGKVIEKLRFPRGSRYSIRRGRGRIIVEQVE